MSKPTRVHKYYSQDLTVRAAAAVTTDLVREATTIQKTGPLASVALGRALTGAVLMASQLREGQQIGLYFAGDGLLGGLFAEATYESEVRGYCPNPDASLPAKDGRLDLRGAIGQGTLNVSRSQPFQKQPHTGIVPIASGEIGQDIAHYLYQSHQIPSVVSLTVHLDGDGKVTAAGGLIIEVMPGAGPTVIADLESRANSVEPLSKRLLAGDPLAVIVSDHVHESPLVEVQHDHLIRYVCRCSRDRVDRTLKMLGKASLAEMILKGEAVPVTCQFCGRGYVISTEELRKLSETLD